MNEPLFGSMTPVWSAATYPPVGWQQTPMPFGSRMIAGTVPGVAASGGAGFASGIPSVMPSPGGLPAGIYAPSSGMPVGATVPAFAGSEIAVGVPVPALLATVAVRRGQPLGPTNDQEIEDFIYDAFELLPGAGEVDVRCEGGRVTVSGAVQHKRLKRDVGEIAWAIPGVNDVHNTVTIAARRRARAVTRETESPGAVTRKTA
jgi:hypothetical protein